MTTEGSQDDPGERPRPLPALIAAFWKPRYWGAWLFWAWMQLMARVPFGLALGIHRLFGRFLHFALRRTRETVRRNLSLSFPALGADELDRRTKRYFVELGASIGETAIAWCASDRHLRGRFEVQGIEHLHRAMERGNGAILYTGHFTPLELCGRPLKLALPRFVCMFSRRSNPLTDAIQLRGRARVAHESIPSDNVRGLLGALKRNSVVWYAPDQAPHGPNAVMVRFFAEPAMMTTATSRLARISNAPVVPFSYHRIEGEARYRLTIHPPLDDFPTDDVAADTQRLMSVLEQLVLEAPDQYLWSQKKFRGRPGLPDPYGRAGTGRGAIAPSEHSADRR